MSRLDRLAIAKDKVKRIVSLYGDAAIDLALLHGSVARGIEKPFSDVDIIIISDHKVPAELTMEQRIVVECFFTSKREALRTLTNPSAGDWFFWAASVDSAHVLYGDKAILKEFKQALNSVPPRRYEESARKKLFWMLEQLGHVKNAHALGDLIAAMGYGGYFRNDVGEFVALINGKHYSSHVFKSLEEAKSFDLLPRGYLKMMKELSTTNDIERIHELSVKLFEACSTIASEKHIGLSQE